MIQILILMMVNGIEIMLISFMTLYFAFKFKNNEKINNPVTAIKKSIEKHRQAKEEEKDTKNQLIMLENIDNYDGTSRNQKDLIK